MVSGTRLPLMFMLCSSVTEKMMISSRKVPRIWSAARVYSATWDDYHFHFLDVRFLQHRLSGEGGIGSKDAGSSLDRIVSSWGSSSDCVCIVSPQHKARYEGAQVLPSPVHLKDIQSEVHFLMILVSIKRVLTGNWAHRSFFITAMARVTAGLRCPAQRHKVISKTNNVQIFFEDKPTSRNTPRYTDPDHEGKTVAKRHVDEVASLVSDGSSVGLWLGMYQ